MASYQGRSSETYIMNIVLFIDTTQREKILVALTIDGKEYTQEQVTGRDRNQHVLPIIMSLLQDHSLSLENLTRIRVRPGPGSFTGIRVGMAIGQALSYALDIPIDSVEPVYDL